MWQEIRLSKGGRSVNKLEQLIDEMILFEKGNAKHVQHFLKVYEFAHMIALREQVSENISDIVEAAAIVHDIGINISLEKYGSSSGHYQELEGPALAENMLMRIGYDADFVKRVAYLVGHHHTYTNMDGLDYQILVEADFLVNMYEENYQQDQIESVYKNIFKTSTGKKLCQIMFL